MWLAIPGVVLVSYYLVERAVATVRKARIDKIRANADYPVTYNDLMGRTVI